MFQSGGRQPESVRQQVGSWWVITYREEPVARSICSSSGDVEENQPAMMEI
jgi:hypothetical protein